MISFYTFVCEKTFVPSMSNKGEWAIISTDPDKKEFSNELISIVRNAYNKTPYGSFVKSIKDVLPSDWLSIDFDNEPDIDATIFYREARSTETWDGYKIQGIGHDGDRSAIDKLLKKLFTLLNKDGWWVEASDALEHILYKNNIQYINEEDLLQKIFNDSNLKLIGDRGKYERYLPGGKKIVESVFGSPILRSI